MKNIRYTLLVRFIIILCLSGFGNTAYAQIWKSAVHSLDGYRESDEELCEVIKDGQAYLPPQLSEIDYYWTNLYAQFEDPVSLGSHFAVEWRVKNSGDTGGIDAFDIKIPVIGENATAHISFMGASWALNYTSIGIGNNVVRKLPELLVDFSDWCVIRLEITPNQLHAFYQGRLLYTLNHTTPLCNILEFGITFKGSGIADWVKIYDAQERIIYNEDFSSCQSFTSLDLHPTRTGVINDYAAVEDICANIFSVDNSSPFSAGDTVLIIQMKGVQIDTTNNENFGKIIDYGKAGNYEFNVIRLIEGNKIHFRNHLLNEYDVMGRVQLVSYPDIGNASVCDLTCAPWDNNKGTGGVLAFTAGQLRLEGNITVNAKGFYGGRDANDLAATSNGQSRPDFLFLGDTVKYGGEKGESIGILPSSSNRGKGRNATGGGGGNYHNGGGGGGANGGNGGEGGVHDSDLIATGGIGGRRIPNALLMERIFLGGGGGAGHGNNDQAVSGGRGGGVLIINAETISRTGNYSILADGGDAPVWLKEVEWPELLDGGGGGGGGGTILLNLSMSGSDSLSVSARGGRGGSVEHFHGHGGGGGGGIVRVNVTAALLLDADVQGGDPGRGLNGETNGATPGEVGILVGGLEFRINPALYSPFSLERIGMLSDCEGYAQIDIVSLGGEQPHLFTLNDGDPQAFPHFEKLNSGMASLNLTDGCDQIDTTIQLVTYPVLQGEIIYTEPVRCDSLGKAELFQTGGMAPFQYKKAGDDSWRADGLFEYLTLGLYQFIIRDERKCSDTLEYEIIDDSYHITIDLPIDTTVQRALPVQLPIHVEQTNENWIINWQPIEGVSCTDCLKPVFLPEFSTDYTLTIRDHWGCVGKAQTRIEVENISLYYPNAFSPNNDGINDYFYLMSAPGQVINILQFHIYDRWGNKIFSRSNMPTNDPSMGWDGTYQGRKMPTGVYVFFMEVELVDGTKRTIKGSVTTQ